MKGVQDEHLMLNIYIYIYMKWVADEHLMLNRYILRKGLVVWRVEPSRFLLFYVYI
jgi:hypothetical protein